LDNKVVVRSCELGVRSWWVGEAMGNLKFEMINLIRLHCVSPGQASGKRKASGFAELRRDKESRKLVFLRVRA
jgi:hypothetical protein